MARVLFSYSDSIKSGLPPVVYWRQATVRRNLTYTVPQIRRDDHLLCQLQLPSVFSSCCAATA